MYMCLVFFVASKILDSSELLSCLLEMNNVSYEYDRWVVDPQLCKLRGTYDTLIGRACAMFH